MNLKNFRAVIFDLFHTLTSLESTKTPGRGTSKILGVSRESWNEQLWFYSEDRLKGKIKDPFKIVEKMAHTIDPTIADEVIREATENRMKRFTYALEHIEISTIDIVRQLKTSGKLLGLISNGDVVDLAGWTNSPIRGYFDSVIFSCDVGYVKPEREIYELCLRELGVLPQECLYVGDGGNDELRGAKEIGMTTVLTTRILRRLWSDKIPERRKYADYEIDEIKELLH